MTWRRSAAAGICVPAVVAAIVVSAATAQNRARSDIPALRVASAQLFSVDLANKAGGDDLLEISLGLEGLSGLNPAGKIVPVLATATTHPNPVTYVYTLRKGVTFWDGQPLTPNDVVVSYQRYMKPGALNNAYFTDVKSVAASGPNQVTVKLKQPSSSWPYYVASEGPIIEAKFQQAHPSDIGSPAVLNMGTGPYEFTSFVPNQSLDLTANPHWWGGNVPIKKIAITIFTDSSTIATALRSGQVDAFITDQGGLAPYRNIPNYPMTTAPGSGSIFVGFNTQTGPYSDLHVRRAIAHLINRKAMIASAEGGFANPYDGMVAPPRLAGITTPAQRAAFNKAYQHYSYSLAAAKHEMSLSKYPHGFSAVWPVWNGGQDYIDLAQIFAQQLKKIGIKLKVEEWTGQQILAQYYGPRNKILMSENGGYTAVTPTFYFDLQVASSQAKLNGSNVANFVNKTADKYIKEADTAQSTPKLLSALQKIQKLVSQQLPYVYLYYVDDGLVLSNKFKMSGFSDSWNSRPWALSIHAAG